MVRDAFYAPRFGINTGPQKNDLADRPLFPYTAADAAPQPAVTAEPLYLSHPNDDDWLF